MRTMEYYGYDEEFKKRWERHLTSKEQQYIISKLKEMNIFKYSYRAPHLNGEPGSFIDLRSTEKPLKKKDLKFLDYEFGERFVDDRLVLEGDTVIAIKLSPLTTLFDVLFDRLMTELGEIDHLFLLDEMGNITLSKYDQRRLIKRVNKVEEMLKNWVTIDDIIRISEHTKTLQ